MPKYRLELINNPHSPFEQRALGLDLLPRILRPSLSWLREEITNWWHYRGGRNR